MGETYYGWFIYVYLHVKGLYIQERHPGDQAKGPQGGPKHSPMKLPGSLDLVVVPRYREILKRENFSFFPKLVS